MEMYKETTILLGNGDLEKRHLLKATKPGLEPNLKFKATERYYLLEMVSPKQSTLHHHGLLSLSWVSSQTRNLDDT